MPTRTTDHLALRHPVKVQVCRAVENGPCANIGSLSLTPGKEGAYTDELPADLAQGPDRLLRYEVALHNHAGKSAGPSNPAYSAAGVSPAAVTGLTGAGASRMVSCLAGSRSPSPGDRYPSASSACNWPSQRPRRLPNLPSRQPHPLPRRRLSSTDRTAKTRVTRSITPPCSTSAIAMRWNGLRPSTLSGQSVEVQGLPSEAIVVTTTDVFPPAVPQGLVAVADAAAGAIDLSWSPDTESDLAAYRVYRRDVHGGLPAQRIASVGVETSYRDTAVQPGHTYAYSVSAVDQSGNESKRSPEVEETLPSR